MNNRYRICGYFGERSKSVGAALVWCNDWIARPDFTKKLLNRIEIRLTLNTKYKQAQQSKSSKNSNYYGRHFEIKLPGWDADNANNAKKGPHAEVWHALEEQAPRTVPQDP